MQKTNNLQDIFLTQVRRERRSVTIFLMNGFQMRGYVTGFDSFTVVLTTDGKQQVIYKHAISTIVPERPIPLYDSTGEGMSAPVTPPRGGPCSGTEREIHL